MSSSLVEYQPPVSLSRARTVRQSLGRVAGFEVIRVEVSRFPSRSSDIVSGP